MTEADWFAATQPKPLLAFAGAAASDRKVQLWACACCRRIWHLITDERSRRAVEMTEQFADDPREPPDSEEIHVAARRAENEAFEACQKTVPDAVAAIDGYTEFEYFLNGSAAASACDGTRSLLAWGGAERSVLQDIADDACRAVGHAADPHVVWPSIWERRGGPPVAEAAAQADLFRDIIGNPFRLAAIHPDWRTSTVIALAEGIYADRAFDRMPILADALLDAGCADDDILNHCRSDAVHVRGCWVVDLLTGRI